MKILLLIIAFIFTSCANVSTSRFSYQSSDGSKLTLEIPKEIQAKKLKVVFNAQQGTAEIIAESWISRNQETIRAQAGREATVLESSATLIEKASSGISEGFIKGAKKGMIP